MIRLYRWLLYLYPSHYRREYADEMCAVFREAQADVGAGNLAARISFRVRETWGLLAGAAQEHFRMICGNGRMVSYTRCDMRPEFRFPRSTVFLMSIIFAGVVLALEKADKIQVKYRAGAGSIWPSLPRFLGLTFLLTCALGVAVWGILFALKRTGTHRLANLQPGPNRPE